MNTEIPFSGIASVPDPRQCPDGQAEACVGLIAEHGALHPLTRPRVILELEPDESVLYIHKTTSGDNYILAQTQEASSGTTYFLSYIKKTSDGFGDKISLNSVSNVSSVTALGNTLIVSTPSSLRYYLWIDGAYKPLVGGNTPFLPVLSFGMRRVFELTDTRTLGIEGVYLNTHLRMTENETNTNAVMGFLLDKVNSGIVSSNYFYQPFFIRYAFRLFDGSYVWHSAPILMLPWVLPPEVKPHLDNIEVSDSGDLLMIPSTLSVPAFELLYRFQYVNPFFEYWKDVVTAIDIFVSPPIYTYDQSGSIDTTVTNMYNLLGYYSETSASNPDTVFSGHYAERYVDDDGRQMFTDHSYNKQTATYTVFRMPKNKSFHDQIREASRFYRIASIPFADIVEGEDGGSYCDACSFKRLKIDTGALSSLETRQQLPDDYRSLFLTGASDMYVYNSRLNLAGVAITPCPPLPLWSSVEATQPFYPGGGVDFYKPVFATVYTKLNGMQRFTQYVPSGMYLNKWDLRHRFPRYLFYPDPSAYKIRLQAGFDPRSEEYDKYDQEQIDVTINLTPHDFLNGAYWYSGVSTDRAPFTASDEENSFEVTIHSHQDSTEIPSTPVPYDSQILTSEVNNPFLFPALGVNQAGSGRILAIASAAKPLSQGQFGQFPLYAFTTDGVWALSVGSDGFYSACQPICQDVCTNPDAVTQLESSVVFPTSAGLKELSGSVAQLISEPLGRLEPFDASSLPGIAALSAIAQLNSGQVRRTDFPTFLRDARIAYDYPRGRIIVAGDSVSYIYSVASRQWGMIPLGVSEVVSSWPDALGVVRGNDKSYLFDLTWEGAPYTGFYVSRPLKLGVPDTLKSVTSAIVRGDFSPSSLKCLLYASRDLRTWTLLWSSRDSFLQGLHGAPWRYFRIAFAGSVQRTESIQGLSVEFAPRLSNRPR